MLPSLSILIGRMRALQSLSLATSLSWLSTCRAIQAQSVAASAYSFLVAATNMVFGASWWGRRAKPTVLPPDPSLGLWGCGARCSESLRMRIAWAQYSCWTWGLTGGLKPTPSTLSAASLDLSWVGGWVCVGCPV